MVSFIIDVNLPYYFNLWNSDDYIHQLDINPTAKDEEIWLYAKAKNLTIVTKDSDFSNKILFNEPPPKVIHIKIGNMKINDFHSYITSIWVEVIELLKNYKLINIFRDRIEGIN